MAYFSRARELADLTEIVTADAPQPVAVLGPEGSGKSVLLKELAASSAMPVVAMRGSEIEESWPYAGLSALLATLDSVLDTNCLASISDLLHPGIGSTPQAISQSLYASIESFRREPSLVVIDDADLLDPASQEILGYVIRRSGITELRVVISVCDMPPSSPFHGLHRLRMEPLDICDLLDLGRSLTPSSTAVSALEHVASASGGSPMAFKSILDELPEHVLTGKAPFPIAMRTGSRFATLIEAELATLSAIARESLDYLSTSPFTPVGLFDRVEGTSREALDELVASGFVIQEYGRIYIVSSPIRSAAYRALTARGRLAIHAELAGAAGEGYPELRTWHASYVEHDPRHSPDLLTAARAFAEQGWTRLAVDFAERGLALNSDGDLSEHLCRLSMTLLLDAHFNLARRYLHMARGRDLDVAVPPGLALLTVLLDYIRRQEVVAHGIERTVEAFGTSHPTECAELLCVAAIARLERWELTGAQELIARGASLAGDQAPIVRALTELAAAYEAGLTGKSLPGECDVSRRSGIIRDGLGVEASRILTARALSLAERYAEARSALEDVTNHSPHVGTFWTIFALQVTFSNELRAGQYHRARDAFAQIDLFVRSQSHFVVNHAYMASMIASMDGDVDAATEGLHTGIRLVTPGAGAAQEAQVAIRQARIAMSRHEFELAADYFYRARHLSGPLRNPQLLRFHVDFIAVLVRVGRRSAAQEILAEFHASAREMPSAWAARALAICDTLVLDDEASLRALRTTLDTWADGDHEYLRARALYLLAFLHGRLGQRQEAETATLRAREIFREIGVEVGGAPCAPAEELPETTPLLDLLTEKELAVVELLATGAKNQAIAHELFLSVRAVELRLTNIFRKIGVTSRFELMKVLAGELDARHRAG
ncbi:LuxR C-terminal-related transcriptional regulator [Brachybacterium sp. AOP3-A1-3]|uniref:LuxR C-terminal-related transcriptional regulator n=1 Tax=Brachybacterium sp. AOP3-A1-3 TaxID=3457699 RepID=UPI004033CCBE